MAGLTKVKGSGLATGAATDSLVGIDDNATSTAITVTSVGDVQIGKTINDFGATAGTEIRKADGRVFVGSADGAYINRIGSVGKVVGLRQDGTDVGAIGTAAGNRVYLGGGDTGIKFADNIDAILPYNPSTLADKDAAVDLGYSTVRYKDLYLSGGVYLGGTGAANKLDDYEEGTWTPQLARWTGGAISATYTEQTGTYTKIGNMVTISFSINISAIASQGSSLAYIANKPFNISSGDQYNFTGIIGQEDAFGSGTDVGAIIPHNSNNAIIFRTAGANGGNLVADWTTGTISGCVTYKV